MDSPILDFFYDKGLINKNSFVKNNQELFVKVSLLKKYKINTALFIFFKKSLSEIVDANKLEEVYNFTAASNTNKCYIYDKKFIIAFCPLGAPAAVALMEELGFIGIKNFFVCGSAGQIDMSIDPTQFVLVNKAIRCEGTSYHYLEPSLYVETNKILTNFIAKYLKENNYKFNKSTTWTTDAFYRETQQEIDLRKSQGAVCVEMESAGLAAVAKFRKYKFTELLYFSDAVKQEGWAWHPTKSELKLAVIKLMIDCVGQYVMQNNSIK